MKVRDHMHECTGREMYSFGIALRNLARHHLDFHEEADRTIQEQMAREIAAFFINPAGLAMLILALREDGEL